MEVKEKKKNLNIENDGDKDEIQLKKQKQNQRKANNKVKKLLICGVFIVLLSFVLIITTKEGDIEVKVKSSLNRVVEKSDLETVNFTYNVIAKKCKNENNCDKKSNNINDFEYVVSCKGTVTAGIEFKEIKVNVNKKNKKVIVEMPEAGVKEINIGSLSFLNGEDIPANELPNARNLCKDTVIEKSKNDKNLLPAAKEQAKVVLQSFYEQWLKAFDKQYKIEVK